MSTCTRGFLIFTNLLTFLASSLILASALLLRLHGETRCSGYVHGPVLVIGILLLLVSLIGMIGSCWRITFMVCIYLCVMLLEILGLLCFTLVVATVLPQNHPKNASSGGLPPLQEYSYFLRSHLIDGHHWVGVKTCLAETHVCSGSQLPWTRPEALSPIRIGCCNPPSYCGYDLMNRTTWALARTSISESEFKDCRTWNNETQAMCYDCDSCKAGFLARIRKNWMRIITVINILIAYLLINFFIGSFALRSILIADMSYTDYS